jgi:adenylate kinase
MGKRVLIFGPPAAGKGTHAKRLARDLKIPHIATGDMLRQAIAEGTPLGREAAATIGRGELVPDLVVNALVEQRLASPDARDGYLLDGYPRTVPQAQALDRLMPLGADAVLALDAPEEVLVNRIAGRSICAQCQSVYNRYYRRPQVAGRCDACGGVLTPRSDDDEPAVRRRLEQYRAKTAPVLSYFVSRRWPVHTVESVGAVDEIYDRLRGALGGAG